MFCCLSVHALGAVQQYRATLDPARIRTFLARDDRSTFGLRASERAQQVFTRSFFSSTPYTCLILPLLDYSALRLSSSTSAGHAKFCPSAKRTRKLFGPTLSG